MARRLYTIKSVGTYLARRDGGWKCHYCGCAVKHNPTDAEIKRGIRKATVDHKKALGNGGEDAVRNMVLCCNPCNDEKGTQDYLLFRTMTWNRRRRAERNAT